MKRFQFGVVLVSFMAFVIAAGCNSDDGDLLDDYKGHVSAAIILVSDQMNGEGTSDVKYHSRMEGHLNGMEEVGEHMADQCSELAVCPRGGGATGDVRNGHMTGGHMLAVEEMNEMYQGQSELRDEMDRFEGNCIEVYSGADVDVGLVDCGGYRAGHFEHMYELLDSHYEFCDGMMGGGHKNRGGMM